MAPFTHMHLYVMEAEGRLGKGRGEWREKGAGRPWGRHGQGDKIGVRNAFEEIVYMKPSTEGKEYMPIKIK